MSIEMICVYKFLFTRYVK